MVSSKIAITIDDKLLKQLEIQRAVSLEVMVYQHQIRLVHS